jgi:putative tricarboxylic transport membrane protein
MTVAEAFLAIFEPITFFALFFGLLLGIIFGAIPGIGGVLGMAILLPLTTGIDGITAVILLTSIYLGSLYGGAVSAILLNIPGTGAAVASTFDGHPLSKQGRSNYALSVSAISSALGGFIASILLILIAPYLVNVVLAVNTPQYFLIAIFGLAILPLVVETSQVKGLFAVALGLLVMSIGVAPGAVTVRYGFDISALHLGINYVGILIGLFAISEMLILFGMEREQVAAGDKDTNIKYVNTITEAGAYVIKRPVLMIKSTIIGLGVGSVPGTGASISNMVSYAEAVRSSDDPDSYGEGNTNGLIASEAANNATCAGSLVPVLTFGIPGGAAAAVIMGGMILHGITPGPRLFTSDIQITQTIFASTAVGSLLILVIGILGVVHIGKITRVDKDYIIPLVIVFAISGSYSLNISFIDVFTVLFAGLIGYLFRKFEYSIVALLLGAILGGIIETNLLRSLNLGGGSYSIFIEAPLSIFIIFLIFAVTIGPSILVLLSSLKNSIVKR